MGEQVLEVTTIEKETGKMNLHSILYAIFMSKVFLFQCKGS